VKIIEQKLLEDGILTTYESGKIDMVPYKIDENDEEYADLFPNDHPQQLT